MFMICSKLFHTMTKFSIRIQLIIFLFCCCFISFMTSSIFLKSWYFDITLVILTSFFGYLDITLRLGWHSLAESGKNPSACLHSGKQSMRTAFSPGLNENDFFTWVEWGRLFHLGWMRTAFSSGLNENGFLSGLNGDDFFDWVGWGRLFHLSWMGTAFSPGLNGNGFLSGLNGDGFFIWGRLFRLG
jgi:hypothetical protein